MSQIGIIVEFHIKPGSFAAFDAHIREHARLTKQEEPGCERFDVLQPRGGDGKPDHGRVMLFELYRDQAAFDAHRANPRLPIVQAGYKDMIESRTLSLCDLGK
jgi:quinol monooxygenase YgiN